MSVGESRPLNHMSRKELRALRREVDGAAVESVGDDDVRYTTFDFVRRGIHDPHDAPLRAFREMSESRARALEKAADERKALISRSRPSDGVRPYLDFHAGQNRAAWLNDFKGEEPQMSIVDALKDRMIAAQREILVAPTEANATELESATKAYEVAVREQEGSA